MAEENAPVSALAKLSQKKVAGIPVLWIAVVVAAVALYGAIAMRPSPEEPVTDETDDIEGDEDVDTSVPVFESTPVIYQPSGPQPGISSAPGPDTNELWGRRAIDWLIAPAQGYTLGVASSAIDKYLNGLDLSYQEAEARDKAVRQFGIPPEGILTTNNPSAPVTPPSTQGTPPTTHTVRNSRDNTASELARLYYGSNSRDYIDLIDSRNVGVPHPYPVGTKVKIPAKRDPKYVKATSAMRTAGDIARRNNTTSDAIRELNPKLTFPVKPGTRVRVR